jgi:hypothetical protein
MNSYETYLQIKHLETKINNLQIELATLKRQFENSKTVYPDDECMILRGPFIRPYDDSVLQRLRKN